LTNVVWHLVIWNFLFIVKLFCFALLWNPFVAFSRDSSYEGSCLKVERIKSETKQIENVFKGLLKRILKDARHCGYRIWRQNVPSLESSQPISSKKYSWQVRNKLKTKCIVKPSRKIIRKNVWIWLAPLQCLKVHETLGREVAAGQWLRNSALKCESS
jgi:hypothetical protein